MTDESDGLPPSQRRWSLALLMIGSVLAGYDRHVLSVLVEPIKDDLGLSDTAIGFVQGFAFAICYALAAVPVAWAADRGHRTRIVAGCVYIWSVGTALCGLAANYVMLLTGRIVTAISEAGFSPTVHSIISDGFPRRAVARTSAFYLIAPSIGLGMALIGGGALLARFNDLGGMDLPVFGKLAPWQCVLVVSAVPGIALATVMLLTMVEPRRRSVTRAEPENVSLREALSEHGRFLAPFVGGCTLTLLVMFSLAAWAATFIARQFDVPPAEAAGLIGPTVLFAGIAGPLMASFMLRSAEGPSALRLILKISLVASALCAVAIALLPATTSLAAAIALISLAIFFASMVAPMIVAPIQLVVPNRVRARFHAISSFFFTVLAGGLGPALIGAVTDHIFGDEEMIGYSISLVCATSATSGVGLIFLARRRLPSE